MGFLAPWFLAGLALVGLPVWLHLLRQHKSTPLPFSSLMFFERRTQSSIKHRRLRYLLLFALRTALLVALALAFAAPFVMSSSGPVSGGRKLLVAAIDNSFSMRQGQRLERAKQQAARVLSGLRPGDRGQVLAFASQARLLNDPANDSAALRAALQTIQPSDARSSFAELSRTARTIAQSARVPVELHLFSDMQKSSLPSTFSDLRLGEGVKLIPHPVTEKRLPNFAVESVNAPRRIYDPKKVRIRATIAGLGTERATRRVSLVLNTREVASKQVEIPASGRAIAEFLTLEAPHGFNRGEIRLDSGDAFPADDHFYFPIERADPRPVLFVHEARNSRDVLYFRTALDASAEGAFTLDVVPSEQCANLSPAKYAFVVLSDLGSLPSSFEDALRDYVRGGGAVFIALGHMSMLHNRVPVGDEVVRNVNYSSREGERFQTVAYLDPAHPSIRRANRWEGVKFYQAIYVEPGKSRVIARLSDQTPLLLEKKIGEGRLLVFASTFDNISNDFPLHASFVPFIEQTAQYLGQLDLQPALFTVGSYLELRSVRERGAAIEVLDPRGQRALSLSESTRAQNMQLEQEGFYEVRKPSRRHELVAVNPDRRESDLDVIPAETLALWQNTGQGSRAASSAENGQKPRSYWWYVMILALALAIAESLLGNRHLSIDKETA